MKRFKVKYWDTEKYFRDVQEMEQWAWTIERLGGCVEIYLVEFSLFKTTEKLIYKTLEEV